MLPAGVLVFLMASDFFVGWNGAAVSTRPPRSVDPASFTVLIANTDGTRVEREWPAELVRGLALPVDSLAIPPAVIPPERPRTSKSRYQLHYIVKAANAEAWTVVPTTSPQRFGFALIAVLVAVAVRNMIVAGSPIAITPRKAYLPPAQAASGQVATRTSSRGQKGPPPPRPRKGRGRR